MKFWLTGITSAGNYQHLKDLIEPIKEEFDGLCWLFHEDYDVDDKGHEYVLHTCIKKQGGCILYSKWLMRTDYSRNKILFEGPMEYGDWFLVIDTLERISPDLIKLFKNIIKDDPQIGAIYINGKRAFIKHTESLQFVGNPHEGLQGIEGKQINLLTRELPEHARDWWQNLRPKYRDKFHWVDAYLNYYFFPNTNHLLLGYENNIQYVRERYDNRKKFLTKLKKLGIKRQVEDLKRYVEENGMEEIRIDLNKEKILNDWYRFHFLNDRSIVDKHDPSLIREV